MSTQAEQDLERAIDEAKSLDNQYEIKRVIHQALMDHYFKDKNPMLMNESEPEEAEALFKKVGEWMDRIFEDQTMNKQAIANELKEITVNELLKEPKERRWHFALEKLIDKLEK